MKKNIILFIFLLLNYVGYSQEYIDDSNFDEKINEQSLFGDDETNIVVIEFWAKFNEKMPPIGIKLRELSITELMCLSKSCRKKEYRVRMHQL